MIFEDLCSFIFYPSTTRPPIFRPNDRQAGLHKAMHWPESTTAFDGNKQSDWWCL